MEKILKKLAEEVGEDVVNKKVEKVMKSKEMQKLLKNIDICNEAFDFKKLREYRELVKKLKKVRYYEMRKFRTPRGEEVSIEERGENIFMITDKIAEIFKKIGGITLLDIGCGEFPSFIIEKLPSNTIYIAIDNRKEVIEALKSIKTGNVKLILVQSDASKINFKNLLNEYGIARADLTLLLRTLRVLQRTSGIDPIEFIESIPTRAILISEPLKSLVRGDSIDKKEKKFILSIARRLEERGIFAYSEIWTIGDEIFLLLK